MKHQTLRNLVFSFAVLIVIISLYAHVPRNKQFSRLETELPNVDIRGAYYINMDLSTDRKSKFLAGFNGNMPLERVPGVKVEKKIGRLGTGTRGCALAHAEAMNKVANKPKGWYLICEDDCVGNFKDLEKNVILRNIVHRTTKQFINLGRYRWSTYSLTEVNLCLQAYLLTPECASKTRREILNNIDSPKALPVDELIVKLYRTPKFIGQSGDGSGCHVRIFDAVGPSIITQHGR